MSKVGRISNDMGPGNLYIFYCPGCKYSHSFRVAPGAWGFNGDLDKPTVEGSILVNADLSKASPGSLRCHSFIKDGMIQFLDDCTHELKGQTVSLENI